MDDNIYDTAVYTDYADLPKETQKSLYKEYLASYKDEKRLSLWFILTPAFFGAGILALLISALVVFITQGLGIPFIVLITTTAAALLCFIVAGVCIDKVKYAHELRFAAWLKTEKRVIAELKRK